MTETAKNDEGSMPSEEHIALMRPYLRLVKYLPDEFVELCIELLSWCGSTALARSFTSSQ